MLTAQDQQELAELRAFKELYDLRVFKANVEATKPPRASDVLLEQSQQFAQMAKDIEGVVNEDLQRIIFIYKTGRTEIPIDIPELGVLYDDILKNAVVALTKTAEEYMVHSKNQKLVEEGETE